MPAVGPSLATERRFWYWLRARSARRSVHIVEDASIGSTRCRTPVPVSAPAAYRALYGDVMYLATAEVWKRAERASARVRVRPDTVRDDGHPSPSLITRRSVCGFDLAGADVEGVDRPWLPAVRPRSRLSATVETLVGRPLRREG